MLERNTSPICVDPEQTRRGSSSVLSLLHVTYFLQNHRPWGHYRLGHDVVVITSDMRLITEISITSIPELYTLESIIESNYQYF